MNLARPTPEGVELINLAQVGSTNDEVRRLAENGALGPLWVRAESQTNGRGRRGRTWLSAKGNLFMTGLLTLNKTPLEAANLSFVAALAVGEAIAAFVPSEIVTLKWPNDVLLDGRKTSGILLESWTSPHGLQLAIGIGVNVVTQPDNVDQIVACVADHCCGDASSCTAARLSTYIIASFHHWLDIWSQEGFAPIRAAWLLRAGGVGRPIRVNLPTETLDGIFVGLGESGTLALRLSNGKIREISAGDVFFP